MLRVAGLAVALAAVSVLLSAAHGDALAGTVTIAGRPEAYPTIQAAIAAAVPGDVVEIQGGSHPGPVVVDRPLTLSGAAWPVIDGRGRGTVLTITAPDVRVIGLELRGTGISLDAEDSAISVDAPRVSIEGNRIDDALFGVYLRKAAGSTVRGNDIRGKALPLSRRGDGIKVWASDDVVVEGNQVSSSRDVVLWYSNRMLVLGNTVEESRYGLHFMFCDDSVIEGNRLDGDSVGAYLMYSRRLSIQRNVIAGNRGPGGYGLGLKDVDDAVVDQNLFVDNRVAINVDNSPRELASHLTVSRNRLAINDVGIRLMPSVRRNAYSQNSFVENLEHVAVAGGGSIAENRWGGPGSGNFWSDYAGYDADGDGVGDLPYRSDRLSERLMDTHPELRLLAFGPVVSAIDTAARAFPFLKPEPKLVDTAPLVAPQPSPVAAPGAGSRLPAGAAAGALLFAGLVISLWKGAHPRPEVRPEGPATDIPVTAPPRAHPRDSARLAAGTQTGVPLLAVRALEVRYGRTAALSGVEFEVRAGESVAIWGENGAGKTTLLRCVLGLVPYRGSAELNGLEVRDHPRAARRLIGTVHQEPGLHEDVTVRQTIDFYSRLRSSTGPVPRDRLESLGLAAHERKRVRELSGGLKQRLKLAIALTGDPPLLLLDEPTASLDRAGRRELIALLADLRSHGRTLVFASHRLDEVSVLAERVLVLDGGRLIADGEPAPILARASLAREDDDDDDDSEAVPRPRQRARELVT